ncbi:MAG: hypothetical protein KDJ77_00585 [Rhodobiaceae bacterium]|nr:hypothetical protein [Rhodobiaceae bacterium]
MDGPTCDPAANPVLIVVADNNDFYYQEYGDSRSTVPSGGTGHFTMQTEGDSFEFRDGASDSIWIDTGYPVDTGAGGDPSDVDIF